MKVDLKEILELIAKEKEEAKQINPQMAFGMAHIEFVLNKTYNENV